MSSTPTFDSVKESVRPFLELSRPFNAVAALSSFAAGYIFYSPQRGWWLMVVGLIVILILHSVFTVQNDIYDFEIDKANKRKSALTEQKVSKLALERFVLYGTFVALGIAAFNPQKMTFLLFIILFSGLGWAYNCPPLLLSRRPISSIVVLSIYYALLPLLFGYVLNGSAFTGSFYVLCLALSLVRFSTSILKDYKDVAGDEKYDKHTFLLSYGRRATSLASILCSGLGYLGIAWVVARTFRHDNLVALAAFGALLLVMTVNFRRRLRLLGMTDSKRLAGIFRHSFVGENQTSVLLILCLAIL